MSNLYGNPPCCPDTLPPQAEPDYEAKVQAPELGTAEEEPYVNPIMKLSFIDRYLSMWIILTMVLGVLVGCVEKVERKLYDNQIIAVDGRGTVLTFGK